MQKFFTIFHFLVSVYSTQIYTHHLPSLTINGEKGPFTLVSQNTPKHSFIISSFSNDPDIQIKDSKWIRDYQDYSIKNYIQGNHSLLVDPNSNNANLELFVTLCSFDEEISEDAQVSVEYLEPYCSDSGKWNDEKCECFDGFVGDDCSLRVVEVNSSYWRKVEAFELVLFSVLIEDDEVEVDIKSKNEDLQSFFMNGYNKDDIKLPSYLNLANDFEYLKGSTKTSLTSKNSQNKKAMFSIFCYASQSCEVSISITTASTGKKGGSINETLLIAVLSISIPLVISIAGLIILKCSRNSNSIEKNKGLTSESINTYAEIVYVDEKMHGDECAICYENYASHVEAKKVACGHVFHTECIDQWALINAHCPLCRVDFNKCLSKR